MNMKTIIYCSLAMMLLFASCKTIEDRVSPGGVLAASQLQIAVIQNPAGSNTVIFQNNTPGVLMYWDYGSGVGSAQSDTIYVPFAGTFKLKYTAFCGGGTVTDSTTFKVANNDTNYFKINPAWYAVTNKGKPMTWVLGADPNNAGKLVWGNGPQDCASPAWWTNTLPGLSGQLGGTPYTINDQVNINLNGAGNFVVTHPDNSQTVGFFNALPPLVFSSTETFPAISTTGVTFPWPFSTGTYHFTVYNSSNKATIDTLVVHDYNSYNVCVYKRLGAY